MKQEHLKQAADDIFEMYENIEIYYKTNDIEELDKYYQATLDVMENLLKEISDIYNDLYIY